MMYCVEVDRSGLPEENMVLHYNLDKEPTREEIVKLVIDEDCGYDDNYCNVEYYPVG
jgi:hypothetical protein